MKIMNCPLNGPRNISEFLCRGEVKSVPVTECSDQVWTDYLFMQNNAAGEVYEWWIHTPTAYWFVARRNTVTEEILETFNVADFTARLAGDAGT